MSTASDVTVFGVAMGGYYIEDIGVHVFQNTVVTIKAEQALKSRDLWKALSQRTLFRLYNGPPPGLGPVAMQMAMPPQVVPTENLTLQNQELKAALDEQRALTLAMQSQMVAQTAALTALTQAIAQGITLQSNASVSNVLSQSAPALMDAPAFIPTTIRPDNAETRISANMGEAEDTGLAESRSKLRKFRQ